MPASLQVKEPMERIVLCAVNNSSLGISSAWITLFCLMFLVILYSCPSSKTAVVRLCAGNKKKKWFKDHQDDTFCLSNNFNKNPERFITAPHKAFCFVYLCFHYVFFLSPQLCYVYAHSCLSFI